MPLSTHFHECCLAIYAFINTQYVSKGVQCKIITELVLLKVLF